MPKADMPSTTSRRVLLAGAALVAPASLLRVIAAAASGQDPDPHPAWFAEWRALTDWYNGPNGTDDDCPEWRRTIELEGLAAATPARTLPGATAQLRFARAFVDEYGSLGSGVNDEAMLDGALATLGLLAGEARHV
jgi:hypothetical protein